MEWKRRMIIWGIIIGVLIGYRFLLPMVLPFLLAWCLADRLYPVCVKIEKHTKIKKSLVGVFFLTILYLLAGTILYFVASEGIAQLKNALSAMGAFLNRKEKIIGDICISIERITKIPQNISEEFFANNIEKFASNIPEVIDLSYILKIFSLAKNMLLFVSGIIIAFISTIMMIGEMDFLRKTMREYKWMDRIRRIAKRLEKTSVTYLKAQIIIIIVVAIVCTGGFWIIRNPYFLIMGIVVGFLDAIPMIGTGAFLYPMAIYYFFRGEIFPALVCILLDIITSFLREFMEPRLLGEKLGVSPILVLMAVYIGMFLYGAMGVILGPLAFSTIYEAGREWDVF